MKKLAASILLLIYFVVSTGFVVSVHYCMDEVKGIELGHATNDACNQCGMVIQDSDGCCKDEVKVFKMPVDQLITKLLIAGFAIPEVSSFTSDYLLTPLVTSLQSEEPVANGPPLCKQETYLQNCVFRI